MVSVYSVLYTLVLFAELSRHFTVTMPAAAEDGMAEQDGVLLGDEPMTEPAAVPHSYRRNLVLDTSVRDEDGSPKILIFSDMGKGHSIRGLNPAFPRSLPLLADRSLSHNRADHSLKIERRNTDLDMLRCMIGRVYRPCWEV